MNFDKRQYKALLVDFDGTLVGHDYVVGPELERAIKEVRKKGYIFSLATGRSFFGYVRQVCRQLSLQDLQIVLGGAQIVDPVTGKTRWIEYLNDQESWEIVQTLAEKKLEFLVEKGEDVYFSENTKLERFHSNRRYLPITKKLTKIPKILILAKLNQKVLEVLEQELKAKYTDTHIIRYSFQEMYGLDITSARASKHLGVLKYIELLKLHPHELIGIGDGYNDYPLLTACGFKVAMGNAPQELKDIADYVAPAQNESGLLTFFRDFLL